MLLHALDAPRAADVLAGKGIVLPDGRSPRAVIGADGELVWHKTRDLTDDNELKHVFYRQYLHASGALAAVLPAPYATEGIPVSDTAMGLHISPAQGLVLVYGHQLEIQVLGNTLSLRTSPAAAYAALGAVLQSGRIDPFDPALLAAADRVAWEQSARLEVDGKGRRGTPVLVWEITVPDRSGVPHIARLDAATGELLVIYEPTGQSSCGPDTGATFAYGIAYPQMYASLVARYNFPAISSTYFPQQGLPYPFEAQYPAQAAVHNEIVAYHGQDTTCDLARDPHDAKWTWSGDPLSPFYPFYCHSGISFVGGRMPILASGGLPLYDDVLCEGGSLGRAAGDVLWFSHLAFGTFARLGWRADYYLPSPTRIVVAQDLQGPDEAAYFRYTNGQGSGEPADTVVFTRKGTADSFALSACLDAVAHEWGHGVVKYTAGMPYDEVNHLVQAQLTEGFADVLGHIVEWDNPGNTPPVPGGENWVYGNKCYQAGTGERPASYFASVPALCYFAGQNLQGYGTCPGAIEQHRSCHPLGVAFYLLADGGTSHKNPACGQGLTPAPPDTVVNTQGITKARRIFFDTLHYYMASTTTWEDLPSLAVAAAFGDFNQCALGKGPALGVQQATAQAFAAIGYPYSGPWNYCP